jgi:hypothetical protein
VRVFKLGAFLSPPERNAVSSVNFQTCGILAFKIDDEVAVDSQKPLGDGGRLISAAEPDDLWRRTE